MLLPVFSYTFPGQVWRVLTDVTASLLSFEIRHPDHRVSFAMLEVSSQQWLWKDYQPADRWWSSSALLHRDVLLLHSFPDGQNPEPRGLIAIDARQGQPLWSQPSLQLLNLYTDTKILVRDVMETEQPFFLLDLHNGQRIDHTPEQTDTAAQVAEPCVFFPVHYAADTPYVEIIAAFISDKQNVMPEKSFDYLEYKQYIVISYYLYSGKNLENFLTVFDTHSQVQVLHHRLATQRTGVGKDTFFVLNTWLCFINEQTTFLCYEL